MLFRRTRLLATAFDELSVVGSRWTRILGKTSGMDSLPAHIRANLAVPSITIIPTLHVASMKFYDRVLEYMEQASKRNPNVVILLEGICDTDEAEKQQMREYQEIMASPELQQALLAKANENSLFPPQVIHEICNELAVNYDELMARVDTVRLQECYLKPKMAALCGLNLRNNSDLDMKEVQQLLQEESARLAAIGETLPSSVSVSELGAFPVLRANRERKVAMIARRQCERWVEQEIEGEVIVPWGYFHCEAIKHHIFSGSTAMAGGGAATTSSAVPSEETKGVASAAASPSTIGAASSAGPSGDATGEQTDLPAGSTRVVFVEADEVIARVPFGVPREVLEPPSSKKPAAATEADASTPEGKTQGRSV